jgi:hypothetical protein
VGYACYTRDSQGNVECPEGFYSDAGVSDCVPCPAGYSCSTDDGGITTLTACDSTAGEFSGLGHNDCFACPIGHQCPFVDQAIIQLCPPGTYSEGDQQYCTECPAGKRCTHRDNVADPPSGFFSPQGTGISFICPAGWYCKYDDAADPTFIVRPCPENTWSEAGNEDPACTPCTEEGACLVAWQSEFTCPEGMIQGDANGAISCTECAQGTYARIYNETAIDENADGIDDITGEAYVEG